MRIPAVLGKIIYFFGYPIFRLLIKNTNRAYVAVIVNDKQILLTKNWLGFQNTWRLPGGGVHKNELPVDAAVRELKEEVGITALDSTLMKITTKPLTSRFNYSYNLFVLHVKTEPRVTIDNQEILDAKFFTKKATLDLSLGEEADQIMNLISWR